MKKVVVIILAFALCCSLCACGSANNDPDSGVSTTITPESHVHSFGEWTVSKEPGCKRMGEETRSCECGVVETKRIPATGHSYTETGRKEPTSSSRTNIYIIYSCSSCGTSYEERMEIVDSMGLECGFCYSEEYGIYCEIGGVDTHDFLLATNYATMFTFPKEINGYPIGSIGDSAFNKNLGLTNIVIRSGVFHIGNYAFEKCYSLERITIPDSVTYIGEGAFGECMCLKEIRFTGTVAQWNAITKGENWVWPSSGAPVVYCSDGEATIAFM